MQRVMQVVDERYYFMKSKGVTGVNRSFRSTTNKFPYRFNRYQQQSGLWEKGGSRGLCGISKGGGKRGKPVVGFPRFPRAGFFHSSAAAAFYVFVLEKKLIIS
jgi:hypothetical protein